MILKNKALTVIEYAMLFLAISIAVLGMGNYVRRSVQGTLKLAEVVINDPKNWEQAGRPPGGNPPCPPNSDCKPGDPVPVPCLPPCTPDGPDK